MAISLQYRTVLNHTSGSTPTTGPRTTSTFDCTGFTHILVGCKHEGAATTITPSSTAVSGSWTSHTKETNTATGSDLHGQFFSAAITSATTGRTATINLADARTFITVAVWLINTGTGVITLVSEANASSSSAGTALDGGTLSNAGGDSVVSFMMMLEYSGSTHTGAAGWAEDFDLNGTGGDNFTAGYSRGPETTASVDPSGTQTSSAHWGVISLMFKEGSAGGATYNAVPLLQYYQRLKRGGIFH